MRLLHTADWHLGRVFHRVDLLDEQRYVLDQLISHVEQTSPDLVVIAGDIYDRSVPPAAAVELLDDVLGRLAGDLQVPTLVIAGNHDSMPRLGFGARLLAEHRLHVYGRPSLEAPPLRFSDEHGPLHVYSLPYPEPALVRELLSDASVRDHQAAMAAMVASIWRRHPPGERAVLVTHADVAGGRVSDSERLLSVTRGQSVAAETFEGFAYVALGHLHRPQDVGTSALRYAGSLYPYSFSEAGDAKSVSLVEIDGAGRATVEELPLLPRRRVRLLEGRLRELLAAAPEDPRRDDFLRVTLADTGPVVEAMTRLRQAYPHLLEVDRPKVTAPLPPTIPAPPREQGELEHFAAFFEHATGEALGDDLASEVTTTLQRLRREEAERATAVRDVAVSGDVGPATSAVAEAN